MDIALNTLVFDRAGRQAKYVALIGQYHIVRPGITIYSADPDIGEDISYEGVDEWHEVFLKPPVEKLNEEVAALEAKVQERRAKIYQLDKEVNLIEGEMTARKGRIKQHEQLALLDDYLADKITHFVIKDMGWGSGYLRAITILPFADAIKLEDKSWNDRLGLKLLTLYGNSKGDLTWQLSSYSNGSGRERDEVIPCTSLEQARAIATKLYEEQLAGWRASLADPEAKTHWWGPSNLLAHAKSLDLPIPQDAVEAIHHSAIERATKELEAARKAVLIAEADLSAAQIGAAPEDRPGRPVRPKACV